MKIILRCFKFRTQLESTKLDKSLGEALAVLSSFGDATSFRSSEKQKPSTSFLYKAWLILFTYFKASCWNEKLPISAWTYFMSHF